jgi:hypothetical protein
MSESSGQSNLPFWEMQSVIAVGVLLERGASFEEVDEGSWLLAEEIFATDQPSDCCNSLCFSTFPLTLKVSVFHRVYSFLATAKRFEELRTMVLIFQLIADDVGDLGAPSAWNERMRNACPYLRELDLDDKEWTFTELPGSNPTTTDTTDEP